MSVSSEVSPRSRKFCPSRPPPAVLLLTHRFPRGDISTVFSTQSWTRVPGHQVGALCLCGHRLRYDTPKLFATFHYHPSVNQLSHRCAEGDQLSGLPGILLGSALKVLSQETLSARQRDSWSPRESPGASLEASGRWHTEHSTVRRNSAGRPCGGSGQPLGSGRGRGGGTDAQWMRDRGRSPCAAVCTQRQTW